MQKVKAGLRRLTVFVAVVFAAVAVVPTAFAQSDRGTIQGLVQDKSGAVVPGATVEITHLATAT